MEPVEVDEAEADHEPASICSKRDGNVGMNVPLTRRAVRQMLRFVAVMIATSGRVR
jgi:hypothetical protein